MRSSAAWTSAAGHDFLGVGDVLGHGRITVRTSSRKASRSSSTPLIAAASSGTTRVTASARSSSPRSMNAHQFADLRGEVVGHADDLGFPVQDVAIGRDRHALLREAGERRAALRREHFDGLLHRARQADELERGIDAAPAGRRADRLHRIGSPRVDRDGAVALRERELRGIDVHRVDLGGAEGARELDRGDAEPADAEDRDGVARHRRAPCAAHAGRSPRNTSGSRPARKARSRAADARSSPARGRVRRSRRRGPCRSSGRSRRTARGRRGSHGSSPQVTR